MTKAIPDIDAAMLAERATNLADRYAGALALITDIFNDDSLPCEVKVRQARMQIIKLLGETPEQAQVISKGRAILVLGYISAELAARSGAWDGNAPDWFPEPPEWLELWEEGLRKTEGEHEPSAT